MSKFAPAYASPQRRPVTFAPDLSRSSSALSAISAPELLDLSPDQVAFLDRVVAAIADPSVNTFSTVFNAYHQVLRERGIDSRDEVVYYSKILKLGTLKGTSWADKWQAVKAQNGYASSKPAPAKKAPMSSAPRSILSRLTTGIQRHIPAPESDTFTLHSYQDDTEIPASPVSTVPDRTPIPRRLRGDTTSNSLGLDTGTSASFRPSSLPSALMRRPAHYDSEGTEAGASSSTRPPSYGAATQSTPYLSHVTNDTKGKTPITRLVVRPSPNSIVAPEPARRAVAKAREAKSVINDEDAWKKIRQAQDEEDAVRWRNERLLERCWMIWRQGYEWTVTTNEQVSEARDSLTLRLALHRWHTKAAARLDLCARVTALANRRLLRLALRIWMDKVQERQQAAWRHEMRAKMRQVRAAREDKLRKDAWAKWRQGYQSHLGEAHYNERLALRTMERWRGQLRRVDEMEMRAEEFAAERAAARVGRCWERWRAEMVLGNRARVIEERVARRVMKDAVQKWRARSHDVQHAEDFYDVVCMKAAIRAWKSRQERIRARERKADRYLARQNDVLKIAIMRVWKAQERGKLLEKVLSMRLLKQMWAVWQSRIRQAKQNQDLALAFSLRASSSLASSSLARWRQMLATHRNAAAFAEQYRAAQLKFQMLLAWRLALRRNARMAKQARRAGKVLVLRRTWETWKQVLEERKREKKLRQLETGKVKKVFEDWLERARRQRHMKLAEQAVQHVVSVRITRNTLTRWMTKVVELKSREIDADISRERAMLSNAFRLWKAICIRHAEELSLLESYQDVQREEMIRRMYNRWASQARAARHRRITLEQKEADMRQATIATAWDRWRGRFKAERLRPLEHEFVKQSQKNILYRAFGIWHSKTMSLPAIRFHASYTKSKAWQKWRDTMPRALQAKEARDAHRHATLAKAFEKWLRTYRTKIALKAVVRARYLRLPTSAPRVSPRAARSPPPPTRSTALSTISRPSLRSLSPEKDDDDEPVAGPSRRTTPFSRRRLNFLSSISNAEPEPRPSMTAREPSPVRSRSSFGRLREREREPSPVRSVHPPSSAGGEGGRGRLWIEMQEVKRRKSNTPSSRVGSSPTRREPP